jgi:SAM-dependent methyltransferase
VAQFPQGRVLELGCGAGKFLATLQRDFPDLTLYGTDISPLGIAQAKEKHPGIDFRVEDAQAPAFPEETFDVICAMDILEHVPQPEKILAEVRRMLKPGGVFHTFVPCEAHSVYGLGHAILGFHAKERTAGHVHQFTRKFIRDLLSRHLEIVEVSYSLHLLGSIMDFALFTALLNRRLYDKFWSENIMYNTPVASPSLLTRVMNLGLRSASAVAYAESCLLSQTSFLAAGLHITATKPPNVGSSHEAAQK